MSEHMFGPHSDHVANENIDAFCALYAIEVGLREFIIAHIGPSQRAWNQLLPGDVLTKFKEAREAEKQTPWLLLCPHHPLYYIDFPDLRKTIERGDNWRNIFQPIFGDRDVICSTLRRIEPIRNSVAHNRKVSPTAVNDARQALELLTTCIGEQLFAELVRKRTTADSAASAIQVLMGELTMLRDKCSSLHAIDSTGTWASLADLWWMNSEYLGHAVENVHAACALLVEYTRLPRHRGEGYRIESWLSSTGMIDTLDAALTELSELQDAGGLA